MLVSLIVHWVYIFGLIYLGWAHVKLSVDIDNKCVDLIEDTMVPTGLYYKDGTPEKRGENVTMLLIFILLIPGMMVGFYVAFSLLNMITILSK